MEGVILIFGLAIIACSVMAGFVAGYEKGETAGRQLSSNRIYQEAVDQGYGFWTVIAAVNKFQWGQPEDDTLEDLDDDAANLANRSTTAPSGEGGESEELRPHYD